VVWGAPIGMFVPFLPFYFTTVCWDGIPYYYANDTYYLWNDSQRQYQVVAPPDGIESGDAAAKRDDYFRGQAACLEGRGYTVR